MGDINLIHGDSLQALKGYGDNHFDVAIVDPPYGIGKTWGKSSCPKYHHRNKYTNKDWNNSIPPPEYFEELYRVSKNQIIWGCNYYNGFINLNGRIVWDKKSAQDITSQCDLAAHSFSNKIDIFRWMWDGYRKQQAEDRIHPTQKPVALYKWLLEKYTSEGDLILDTHLGSGSIAIACHYLGRKLVGYEIDDEYYEKACKRFKEQTCQIALW